MARLLTVGDSVESSMSAYSLRMVFLVYVCLDIFVSSVVFFFVISLFFVRYFTAVVLSLLRMNEIHMKCDY